MDRQPAPARATVGAAIQTRELPTTDTVQRRRLQAKAIQLGARLARRRRNQRQPALGTAIRSRGLPTISAVAPNRRRQLLPLRPAPTPLVPARAVTPRCRRRAQA